MGIRETINERPAIVVVLSVVIILAMAVVTWMQIRGPGTTQPADRASLAKSWFTTDDGKTWFPDDANRVTPFDHQGKKAYRCYVWTCDEGKTKFVSHLERAKPGLWRERQATGKYEPNDLVFSPFDVKPPGAPETAWTDQSSSTGYQIATPRCPQGQSGTPLPVKAN
jgi:hypothetical protein